MDTEFSVLNESNLHNALKHFYAIQYEGKTEVKQDGHIYDIVTKDNEIIEIQTKNLSKLKNKLSDIIAKNRKVRLVYPLINRTTILLTDKEGSLISKRKSPKTGCIYDIFKELTGLTDLLLEENFTLEVVEINLSEHRVRAEENEIKRRGRFPKNYIKVNKHLDDILNITTFSSKKDYLSLLPSDLPKEFISKDLKEKLKLIKVPARISNNPNLILWVLKNMNLISIIRKDGRSYVYKINS